MAQTLITAFMARLNPTEHSHMLHHIQQHMEPAEDAPATSFEFVLDLILDGLEAER